MTDIPENNNDELLDGDFEEFEEVTVAGDDDDGVIISFDSQQGSRKSQQDYVSCDDGYEYTKNGRCIVVLCDGMGGMQGGEVYSRFSAEGMRRAYHDQPVADNHLEFLKRTILAIDMAASKLETSDGRPMRGGTTMLACIIDSGYLYWASVGDSRIYLIRDGVGYQLTEDQNYSLLLRKRVELGEITPEQAENDPQKDALISYLGMGGIKYMGLSRTPEKLLPGDRVLLCSDGLYRAMSINEICEVLETSDLAHAAEGLTSTAVNKGFPRQDNTSAVVVSFLG
ncbi:MAG: protein phosphatase 2C domain-containing protein [Clostridia bacterium]|nr:protein phosphatase 2C domain-containing protein [Clostridia bacterium]